jgi:hypothetical protein
LHSRPVQIAYLICEIRSICIGAAVFTGKKLRGRVLPMNKRVWAMKFKKHAVLAGVNEPKKNCHGVR